MNNQTSNLNLILVPAIGKKIVCEGCFYFGNKEHTCPPAKGNCYTDDKDYIWIQFSFPLGTYVEKKSGSQWEGKVVGFYSTSLTPRGYAVESSTHAGSVQIYPESALRRKEQHENNPAR